jgi:hypothetical protein
VGKVAQIMYTNVSKCKYDKNKSIKIELPLGGKKTIDQVLSITEGGGISLSNYMKIFTLA